MAMKKDTAAYRTLYTCGEKAIPGKAEGISYKTIIMYYYQLVSFKTVDFLPIDLYRLAHFILTVFADSFKLA